MTNPCSLEALYQERTPTIIQKASNGATIRVFDTFAPQTPEERKHRERQAWQTALQILPPPEHDRDPGCSALRKAENSMDG